MKCDGHAGRIDFECRRCQAVQRSDAWSQWIAGQADWNLFGGLTFDPRRRVSPPPGPQRGGQRLRPGPRLNESGTLRLQGRPLAADIARRSVLTFFDQGEQLLGRRLAGIVALEFHGNLWPHFHPLISVEGGLQGGEIKALGTLWYQRAGGNRLEVPRSLGDVSAYASKYLSKGLDVGDVLMWPKAGPLSTDWRAALPLGRARR